MSERASWVEVTFTRSSLHTGFQPRESPFRSKQKKQHHSPDDQDNGENDRELVLGQHRPFYTARRLLGAGLRRRRVQYGYGRI
jgi:hypothetical protein